jgi:hypothetical protein
MILYFLKLAVNQRVHFGPKYINIKEGKQKPDKRRWFHLLYIKYKRVCTSSKKERNSLTCNSKVKQSHYRP